MISCMDHEHSICVLLFDHFPCHFSQISMAPNQLHEIFRNERFHLFAPKLLYQFPLQPLRNNTKDKTTKQRWSHENLNSLQGTMNQFHMPPCKNDQQPLMMRFHLSESINTLTSEYHVGQMIVLFLFLFSNTEEFDPHLMYIELDMSCQFWGPLGQQETTQLISNLVQSTHPN